MCKSSTRDLSTYGSAINRSTAQSRRVVAMHLVWLTRSRADTIWPSRWQQSFQLVHSIVSSLIDVDKGKIKATNQPWQVISPLILLTRDFHYSLQYCLCTTWDKSTPCVHLRDKTVDDSIYSARIMISEWSHSRKQYGRRGHGSITILVRLHCSWLHHQDYNCSYERRFFISSSPEDEDAPRQCALLHHVRPLIVMITI